MIDSEYFGMALGALLAFGIWLYAQQPQEIDGRDPLVYAREELHAWALRWFR